MWAGDVDGDGRSEIAIVNATLSTVPILASTTIDARLAIVGVRTGGTPPTAPLLGPGPLEHVRVVAPGDQSMLPPDSTLKRIVMTAGKLIPAFVPETTAYTVVVPVATTTIRIRPFAAHPWSRITVGGSVVASGTLGPKLTLKLGANPVPIVVTDGGSTTTYDLAVVRATKPKVPTITKVTAPVGGLVRVYWKSAGDGGSPITGWVVQHRAKGTKPWTSVQIRRPDQAGYTISGLATGTTYEVRVVARNVVGVTASTVRSIAAR